LNAKIKFILFNKDNTDSELISRYNIENHLTNWKDIQCLITEILLNK
jgi:hypothetical protein